MCRRLLSHPNTRRFPLVGLWLFLGLLTSPLALLAAETPLQAPAPDRGPSFSPPDSQKVTVGDSIFIDADALIERVAVTDPKIAEALVIAPQQVMINGLQPGRTTLTLWEQGGRRRALPLTVQVDMAPLAAAYHTVLPNESIAVTVARDTIILSGYVHEEATAKRALEMAKSYHKHVVSFLRVLPAPAPPDPPQIMLQVRFAEVDRIQGRDLGLNILSTGAGNTIGAASTQQFAPPFAGGQGRLRGSIGGRLSGAGSEFALSDLLNIFAFRPDLNLGATLKALQTRGLLQILAEPNLITTQGKEASFLAGGEFPYAVVQGGSGGQFPAVHVQFKEFGVRLKFTPTITASGKIRLKVSPEVSDLDFTNALTLSGFTIPSVRTRRADTEIELQDGQSFAIAGLIDNRVIENYSQVPGIGRLPIIGALFRSRSQRKTNSELVVMVTPKVISETSPRAPLPEWETPFLRPTNPDTGETPARPTRKEETKTAPYAPEEPSPDPDPKTVDPTGGKASRPDASKTENGTDKEPRP